MKRMVQWLAVLGLVVGAASPTLAQARFEAGRDYLVLEQPVSTVSRDKVEVREFFAYSCPHCANFVAPMDAWLEQRAPEAVAFVRTPVAFNQSWQLLAQAYHAAEVLDVVEQVHVPLFAAIHNERKRFRNADEVADFFAQRGVDRERVKATLESFAVDMRLRQSEQTVRNHRITSTPSVSVAGKYVINPRTAGSHERMIEVIDYLVRQEGAALR